MREGGTYTKNPETGEVTKVDLTAKPEQAEKAKPIETPDEVISDDDTV